MNANICFKAPWGWTLRVLSAVCATVVTAVSLFAVVDAGQTPAVRIAVAALALLVLGLCAAWTVRGYELGPGVLRIRRLFWATQLPLSGVQLAQRIGAWPVVLSLRLVGNGGFFSFCGWHWNPRLGRYRLFATDLTRLVALRLAGRTIVVTPDRPDEFIAALNQAGAAA